MLRVMSGYVQHFRNFIYIYIYTTHRRKRSASQLIRQKSLPRSMTLRSQAPGIFFLATRGDPSKFAMDFRRFDDVTNELLVVGWNRRLNQWLENEHSI